MRLLLLRHAESVSNADPVAVSLPEARGDRLTQRGAEQALAAARALRDCGATRLIASPMRRALQTAEIIADGVGLPVETSPHVHEVLEPSGYGDLKPEDQRRSRWSHRMSEYAEDPDYGPSGAESFNRVIDRVESFKAELESGDPQQSVLCVSHGIFIRFFLVHSLLGDAFEPRDVSRLWHLRTRNCGLSRFETRERHHQADPEVEGWRCATWMERLADG